MTYRQITFAERYTLALLRQGGLTPAAIARVLGRHRSTIGREVRRNQAHSDGSYRSPLADWYARGRRSRSRRNRRVSASGRGRVHAVGRRGPRTRHAPGPTPPRPAPRARRPTTPRSLSAPNS